LLNLGRFFSFVILYTVCRTPWTGDQPVTRPLPTNRTTQAQNKRTQTSMHNLSVWNYRIVYNWHILQNISH
jgi:hypothetical protein